MKKPFLLIALIGLPGLIHAQAPLPSPTNGGSGGGGGSGTVTSVTLAGTINQITAAGTCTGTTVITCTLSLPSGLVIPGTINGLAITTTTGTLTIATGKVLTVSNTLTLAGTDGVTITFPASASVTDGDCVKFSKTGSNVGLVDAGSACGSGGGGSSTLGPFGYSALTGALVTATTYYAPVVGGAIPTTTEANFASKAPATGTFGNLHVALDATLGAVSGTLAITLRQAGADTTLTCTVAANATTCDDTTHTVSITAADLIDFKLVTAGTITGATPRITISYSVQAAGGGAPVAGTGILVSGSTVSADPNVVTFNAALQAGTPLNCSSTTGNATMTCALATTLSTYTAGQCFILTSDFTNVTTATLNIDTLGAKSVLGPTGAALSAGNITATVPIQVCYNGTSFYITGVAGSSAPTIITGTSGHWWPLGEAGWTITSMGQVANTLRCWETRALEVKGTFTTAGVYLNTADAGKYAGLAFYDSAGNRLTGATSTGTLLTSTGFKAIALGATATLNPGVYFECFISDGTASQFFTYTSLGNNFQNLFGAAGATGNASRMFDAANTGSILAGVITWPATLGNRTADIHEPIVAVFIP